MTDDALVLPEGTPTVPSQPVVIVNFKDGSEETYYHVRFVVSHGLVLVLLNSDQNPIAHLNLAEVKSVQYPDNDAPPSRIITARTVELVLPRH